MTKERSNSVPFYTAVNGKEYKLCVKEAQNGKLYFFLPVLQALPEGASQASFPEGHEVYKNNNLPALRKIETSKS